MATRPGFELSDDTIFVTGLPEDTTDGQLAEYFGQIGIIKFDKKNECKKIWIYKDKSTGKGKGEATITYDDPPTATSAIQWFDGKEFRGFPLKIELAQRKATPQFGRGGGRGGFRGGGGGGGFRDSHRGYGGGRDNFDRGGRQGAVGGGFRDGHRGYGGGGPPGAGGRDEYDRGVRPGGDRVGGGGGGGGGGYRSSQRDFSGNRVRDDHDRGSRPGGGAGYQRDSQRSYGGGSSGDRASDGYGSKHSHVTARGPSSRSDTRGARENTSTRDPR